MEEHIKIIVVPWDFTVVAGHALAHAVKISRMAGNSITLLHIVDPEVKPKDEEAAKVRLKQIAEENSKKYNMNISSDIIKGSIFHEISEYANEKDASTGGDGNPRDERHAKAYRQLGSESYLSNQRCHLLWFRILLPTRRDTIILFSRSISGEKIRRRSRWQFLWASILNQKFIC